MPKPAHESQHFMKPLAIVIPWFGRDLKGGAETQAWQIASRLASRGHAVEVLTTCCRSPHDDWATNHLPVGVTHEPEGFSIRRFSVERRRRKAFDRAHRHLSELSRDALKVGACPISAEDAAVFSHELIKSTELLKYLERSAETYRAFIFMPYFYGPVLNGLPLVASKAYLQPCLHNESYAYLPQVAVIFYKAKGILFNSEGEEELALRFFGPGIIPKSVVVGEGVEVPDITGGAAPARKTFPFGKDPYVLALGRKDHGKNTHLLLNVFRSFKASCPTSQLRLVYAGIGSVPLDGLQGQVFDLGVVSEQDKVALLDGCRALFQPSENESFSRVIMEAWLRGRPVAAHRNCLATAMAVQRCGGGWLAADEREWSALLTMLERASDDELAVKGSAGIEYAREVADWRKVMDRYENVLFSTDATVSVSRIRVSSEKNRAVHQVLPNLTYGDGISNFVRWIRHELRSEGIESEIFVCHIDPKVASECHVFTPGCVGVEDVLLYHHSLGSELTPHVVGHPGPKCLIYHNITPAEFFQPFEPQLAALLRQGREELKLLARYFPVSVGQSAYNAVELRETGFCNPGVLPPYVDPAKWAIPFDSDLSARFQGGHTNLLFVGRLAPNKKQEDLIRVFRSYLDFDPNAILHVVGSSASNSYESFLKDYAAALNIRDKVNFAAGLTDGQLAAYYRFAHLFWSMSEHEGFCVPLIEAMWFDVPVLAFKSSAVSETLGNSGLMFTTKQPEAELAALAWLMVHDDDLRRKLIAAQRQRRTCFLPAAVKPKLLALVDTLISPDAKPAAVATQPEETVL